jgi:hypothetical protein
MILIHLFINLFENSTVTGQPLEKNSNQISPCRRTKNWKFFLLKGLSLLLISFLGAGEAEIL